MSVINMIYHDGIEHSGYMSFMMLVSIFPFLVFMLALTSFLGNSALGARFILVFIDNMPSSSIDSIRNTIEELTVVPPPELLTLAIIGTIWTSSSFIESLRTILNKVYKISTPPNYILRRLLSIVQFLSISLIISLIMFLFIAMPIGFAKAKSFISLIEGHEITLRIISYTGIPVSLFLVVSFLYYVIPNTNTRFLQIIPGSCVTVILWIFSGNLLSKYIIHYNQLSIVYGSLGSVIITLIFFYVVNIIFIIGAEFNYLMMQR